jgi:hypothetical protein
MSFLGDSTMPNYRVTVEAPAIDEMVVTTADNEQQARERAIASALGRQADAATVRVIEVPDETPPRAA